MKKSIFLYLIFAICFSSCISNLQMEKRHYRNGFYFHQNHNHQIATAPDSILKTEFVQKDSVKENDLDQSALTFRKNNNSNSERNGLIKTKKATIFNNGKKISKKITAKVSKKTKTDDQDPNTRNAKIAYTFGMIALMSMIIGLFMLEAFFIPFVIPILVISCFCIPVGISFAGRVLLFPSKKKKGEGADKNEVDPIRKKAKSGYLLSFSAAMLAVTYILVRASILLLAGGLVTGFAFLLLLIALILFGFYRIGLFSLLKY